MERNNRAFVDLYSNLGICRESMAPYTPHQNSSGHVSSTGIPFSLLPFLQPAYHRVLHQRKPEPRARLCPLFNFGCNHWRDCYKLLDVETGKVLYSRDATWHHTEAPLNLTVNADMCPPTALQEDTSVYVPVVTAPGPGSTPAPVAAPAPTPAPVSLPQLLQHRFLHLIPRRRRHRQLDSDRLPRR